MAEFLKESAQVICLTLDMNGRIMAANPYARRVIGKKAVGMKIQDVIIDFSSEFNLERLEKAVSSTGLYSIGTASGLPKSFQLQFELLNEHILLFGQQDLEELETVFNDFSQLNQQLNNVTRQLYKKNAQLEAALAHVKTLQGIIPICMHCHKIRNDGEIWDKLEKYLSENTDAKLSHGICPECLEKYYPEEESDDV